MGVKEYEAVNNVAFQIVQLLSLHPEAFSTLNEAMQVGMQASRDLAHDRGMTYYHGMVAALALTGKGRLDDKMKALLHTRVIEACRLQSCGFESKAFEEHTQALKDIENKDKA